MISEVYHGDAIANQTTRAPNGLQRLQFTPLSGRADAMVGEVY